MTEQVEVVIKIPKYYLTHPQDYSCLAEYVRRGTPLPKGHGRLIDADALGEKLHRYTEAPYQYALTVFNKTPTIIEADKAEKE